MDKIIKVQVIADVEITVTGVNKETLAERDSPDWWMDLAWTALVTGQSDASRLDGWADLESGQIEITGTDRIETEIL